MPLSPPPRDERGNVIPHDHAEIAPADGVIRRVSDQWVTPGKDGKPRLSSMALQTSSDPGGGMSVDLEQSIIKAGLDPKAFVAKPRYTGSLRFQAADFRAEGLKVGYDPLPENPHHGEVWGTISRGIKRRLLRQASWFVELPGVRITDEET